MVTPTYYVYFTSTTIITSSVLFRGFKGTPTSIATVVNGFLTICAGVVLLQLSKSAKDVPDSAVFSGNLDQIQTIAEQEQPETEPKADAIRGTAAIIRRFSVARDKMEMDELKRLHEEKRRERLEPTSEDGQPQYEWDGLRRRRTVYGSRRERAMTSPTANTFQPIPESPHPPLGWSHIPTEEELAAVQNTPGSPGGVLSSIAGTIRTRAKSVLLHGPPEGQDPTKAQSPMHPVQLTEIAVPRPQAGDEAGAYFGQEPGYGLPAGKTDYEGGERRVQFGGDSRQASQGSLGSIAAPPGLPAHTARRQFSFQNVFRRHQQAAAVAPVGPEPVYEEQPRRPGITTRGYSSPHVKDATEEERLGLVQGDSRSMPQLPTYGDGADDADPYSDDHKQLRYGRGITTPPRRGSDEKSGSGSEVADYEARRKKFNDSRGGSRDGETPTPPPPPGSRRHSPPRGGDGAFI